MEARDTLHFWGLTLVILPGVLGGEWAVWYPEKPICAVRRSTVIIPCSYNHPDKYYGNTLKAQTMMWCHKHENCIDTKYVCRSNNTNISPEFKDRAECLVKEKKNCTLKIKDIRDKDSGNYKFRFETNKPEQIWTGQPGVDLQVSDSQ
ncbi:sialic acid-binding Ig-like lectin 14 [Megalops cyprinoides]|uniref:sialic acid-binding Ig-like lectin 14 n=1 Tax=Megalops cyprinoides TaxID=118141 RepID=UPI0018644652|nr:sialic acid-binding Ig-like lectin 14 [Megalops cyprinoides]